MNLTRLAPSSRTATTDGDDLRKLNGEYHVSTRKANGFPLYVHAGTGAAEGETHFIYRHKVGVGRHLGFAYGRHP